MKKIQSILQGSKILEIIKDILSALGSGKKSVQSVYSEMYFEKKCRDEFYTRISLASSIR